MVQLLITTAGHATRANLFSMSYTTAYLPVSYTHLVILKIEVEGAMNIKRLFPECCLVFILPPSMQELERRLRKRGTETEEKIIERLSLIHI